MLKSFHLACSKSNGSKGDGRIYLLSLDGKSRQMQPAPDGTIKLVDKCENVDQLNVQPMKRPLVFQDPPHADKKNQPDSMSIK
jgi:hypothetical protein